MDDIIKTLLNKIKAAGRENEVSFKFKVMDTDELRVAAALSFMKIFDIKLQAKCKTKNLKESIKMRKLGNTMYISNKKNVEKLIEAWKMYSMSIAAAPSESQELSLAYANRSAVLMDLCKYLECIEDINRALNLNYPHHLKGKLLCRKIECLNFLKNSLKIKDTIEEVQSLLKSIDICNEDKEKYESKLKNIQNLHDSKSYNENTKVKKLPTFVSHKEIPCASEAITLKYNKKFGRHIVTTRKVNPGEILIVEKPYAVFLLPEQVYTHCSHCLQNHWAMIPCKFCVYAMYCSEKCMNEAWKNYHETECLIAGYLLDLGLDMCSLFSLRLVILALKEAGSIERLRDMVKKADEITDPLNKGFDKDGLFRSDKYTSVYTLTTNTENRSVIDLFERASKAIFVLRYICTFTPLLGNKFNFDFDELALDENVTFIGGLILRHMQIIPSNIHSFSEEYKTDTVNIGATASPFCSLLNHSCQSNVSRCSTPDYLIIYALVPIETGSQIFDDYGSNYALMNKFEREKMLDRFYFKCDCIACNKNWPTYTNLPSFEILLTNENIKKKIRKTLKNFHSYFEYASSDNIQDKPYLLTDLAEMIEVLLKHVQLPCFEFNNVAETFKRVFALTYGNEFEFPKLN